ncbi:Ras-related protein Rap-1 [Madurella mycetomatis]|uniref:Ras-related protein Rap-1 n=1 Tax=Madurella mycetomatis TaxID=100816 RepID=A0A175WB95_9PEZI|nr:Ras-related protein Rap-1 [Madurella mycetomatis]
MPSKFSYQPCREFNVVVLGAAQFVHNEWIESYDPTIEDSYRTQIAVDGRQVVLEILDTAGTEQFVAMRDLYMKTGQGFLLVFSISSRTSFEELETLRDDIIRIKDDDKIPIVIVGNKADLEDQRAVDRAKAFSLSQRWEAPYYEASARTRTNVDEAFTDLCRQMLRRDDSNDDTRDDPNSQRSDDWASRRRRRRKRKEKCTIL